MSKAGDFLRRFDEADFDDEDMDLLRKRIAPPESASKASFSYPPELHDSQHPIRKAFYGKKNVPPLNGKTAILYFSRQQGSPCLDDLYTGDIVLEPGTTIIVPADGGPVGATKGVFISQSSSYVGIAWYGTDIDVGE